jgi:hypothetical protein
MTPAQLDALLRVHARIHDPKRSERSAERGTTADLVAFARMKRVG